MVTCDKVIKDFEPYLDRYSKSLSKRLNGIEPSDIKQDLCITVMRTYRMCEGTVEEPVLIQYCASSLRWGAKRYYHAKRLSEERSQKRMAKYYPLINVDEPDISEYIIMKLSLQQWSEGLNDRNQKVCKFLMKGYSRREISVILDRSYGLVSNILGSMRCYTHKREIGRMIQSEYCS